MAKTTLFTILNSINYKTKIEYNKKDASAYLLMLWLSHSKDLIKITNDMNLHLFDIPDDLVYKYFFNKVPKKRRFIKWAKKLKEYDKFKKDVEKLKEQYNLSEREALISLGIL